MRATDYVRSVRHTLSSNRLRAALTLLGTVIGAASIVLLAGLLRSGEDMLVYSAQQASESDLITIRKDVVGNNDADRQHHELGRRDEELIESSPLLPGVHATTESQRELVAEPITSDPKAPEVEKDFRVRFVSAAADTVSLYRLEIAKGRGLTEQDLADKRRICVVGHEVWKRLFGEHAPLTDQRMRIDGHLWVVVGVLKAKPLLGGGGGGNETWMWNRKVLVPETTYDVTFRPRHDVDRMYVRLKYVQGMSAKVKSAKDLVRQMLITAHGVQNFRIDAQNDSEGQEKLILSIIKGLLLSTALLSLFVGGINIMNIMLVTVTERTREIGVRRAIGAPPRSIWMQFLLEAAFIAGVGGAVGVASGIGLTWVGARLISGEGGSFAFHIETWSVIAGFLLSVVTGIVFGLFPAIRASRLDPVEALRFE